VREANDVFSRLLEEIAAERLVLSAHAVGSDPEPTTTCANITYAKACRTDPCAAHSTQPSPATAFLCVH
jgi:hypothetical protein